MCLLYRLNVNYEVSTSRDGNKRIRSTQKQRQKTKLGNLDNNEIVIMTAIIIMTILRKRWRNRGWGPFYYHRLDMMGNGVHLFRMPKTVLV
jgi:hypothetical protein